LGAKTTLEKLAFGFSLGRKTDSFIWYAL